MKLLRDTDLREYLIRVISSILKEHPSIIGEDFEMINTKIGAVTDVKRGLKEKDMTSCIKKNFVSR